MRADQYHTNRLTLLRLLLAGILMLALYYGWNQLLPHQLAGSPLFDISIDNTFWLFHFTGIPGWLNAHPVSLYILEAIILVLGIMLFKTGKPLFAIVFLSLFVLLSLFIQTWSCTLTKISIIVPVVLFPFCFTGSLFRLTWKLPRYYLVYLMVSAGLFKILNGGLFHTGQMEHILFNQHLDLVIYGSEHWSLQAAQFLGRYPVFGTIGYWLITIAELSFIALLFTHRFNRLFSLVLVLFCVVIWLTMRIYTLEILFLLLPLIRISEEND